mmetsp:Transcript_15718/g.29830  ORF Transcript_15718/g.29830 Transcript_15718/m.29830 type:complete len:180 (-) Transcript_15718:78-617(-)|eukprot:CAMPEP_0170176450 /NCGR_PEP_ID=MMETSP0040_2-20121228/9326_1 /TAXON_ID=641309 /ORGANISM="Lotharella oceanica, Strain CCMP622" /LENGTH=179 /DNA_ID=CAMNT_0010418777 /DNA_START=48 /DNA_END=587 /DNA_ORIENTATION=+
MSFEPELHVIGEICGGDGFAHSNAFCSYKVEKGDYWECCEGKETGQSQVDYAQPGATSFTWNHPVDLHFFTKSSKGWPAFCFEVGTLDSTGAKSLCGYGSCYVPSTPGSHEIKCPIWRPTGTPKEEITGYFLGARPQLVDKDIIFNKASEQRYRLFTETAGYIKLKLDIVIRGNIERKT